MLELGAPVMAKYVRLTFNGGVFNWVSEISVYGTEGSGGTTDTSEETDTSKETDSDTQEGQNGQTSEEAVSAEESLPEYVEHENKSIAWLYWVIGGVVVVAVIAIALFITKKK
jgi:hypothetical protein